MMPVMFDQFSYTMFAYDCQNDCYGCAGCASVLCLNTESSVDAMFVVEIYEFMNFSQVLRTTMYLNYCTHKCETKHVKWIQIAFFCLMLLHDVV